MDKDMASRMLKAGLTLEAEIGELDLLVRQLNDTHWATSLALSARSLCVGLFVSIRNWIQTDKPKGTPLVGARIVLPLLP
jgi:hypothetical protein